MPEWITLYIAVISPFAILAINKPNLYLRISSHILNLLIIVNVGVFSWSFPVDLIQASLVGLELPKDIKTTVSLFIDGFKVPLDYYLLPGVLIIMHGVFAYLANILLEQARASGTPPV